MTDVTGVHVEGMTDVTGVHGLQGARRARKDQLAPQSWRWMQCCAGIQTVEWTAVPL